MPAFTVKKLYIAKSINELQKKADLHKPSLAKTKTTKLISSANKIFKDAEKHYLEQDEERAFVLYMKFIDLMMFLKDRSDFNAIESAVNLANSIGPAIEKASTLKASLKKRYSTLEEATEKQKNEKDIAITLHHEDMSVKEDKEKIISDEVDSVDKKDEVCSGLISAIEVMELIKSSPYSVVLMDTRSQQDFEESHIKHSYCINVPSEILTPGITAQKLEDKLDKDFIPVWKERNKEKTVVLFDWKTESSELTAGSPLYTLKEALCKWDHVCPLKTPPLILKGGYIDWMLRYPMYTTHVIDFTLFINTESQSSNVDVSGVSYPDLDSSSELNKKNSESNSKTIINGWVNDFPSTVNQERKSMPAVNRTVKPYINAKSTTPEKSSKSLENRRNSNEQPIDVVFKKVPEVKRSLKPDISNRSPKTETASNSSSIITDSKTNASVDTLSKEELLASEQITLIERQISKENEFEKLRLRKELEAEESMRQEIQKQQESLLDALKLLETESKEKEAEYMKTKEENFKMKKLLAEHELAKRERNEQKKKEMLLEAERLRKLRKKKEEESKNRSQSQENVVIPNNLKKEAQHSATEYKVPLAKSSMTEIANRGLMRSYSSPNIAQMVAEEDSEGGRVESFKKLPVVDRTLKPKVSDAPVIPDEISAVRQRNLNPVYAGSSQVRGQTGLKNLGNTCFMNSIIQCLSNTESFVQYFTTEKYRKHIVRNNKQRTKGEVAEEFGYIIKALWMGQYKFFHPKDFKNTVSKYLPVCVGSEQQDAHEFLIELMDKLHGDLNQSSRCDTEPLPNLESLPLRTAVDTFWRHHKRMNSSIVSETFEGLLTSTLTCLSCQKQSFNFEVFSCLSLPIVPYSCSLNDCLDSFLKNERMSGEGAWDCPKCKQKKEAEKSLQIYCLPDTLIIQLKRFSYEGLWRRKLQTLVTFPTSLEITCVSNKARTYSLYGIVNHFGTLEGGHYTAYCKNHATMKWYKYDDHDVNEMSSNDICTSAAYILFYAAHDKKM